MTAKGAGDAIRGQIDATLDGVVQFIKDETGVDLSFLTEAFDGIDLTEPGSVMAAIIANAGDPISLVNAITGLDLPEGTADPLSYLEAFDVLGAATPLNAQNIYNTLPTNIIGAIPYTIIGDMVVNLLANPSFEGAVSVQDPTGVWQWDGTTGATTPGHVFIDATGVEQVLLSNMIPVGPGDKVDTAIKSMWSGIAFTGDPFRVSIQEFLDYMPGDMVDVLAPAAPGANQATWLPIAGDTYTTPATGVDGVVMAITVPATTTAGRIRFDDGLLTKSSALQKAWVDGLPEELTGLWDRAQGIVDTIHDGITDLGLTGVELPVLADAFDNFPWWKVTGYGGPGTMGDTFQATWDEWISGAVDADGTGSGLPDLKSISRAVSSAATRGSWAYDITTFLGGESFADGMLPTSKTSMPLTQVGTGTAAPTFALTQATAITLYERMKKASPLGVIRWMGSGITNISHFFVNVWRMDPTNGNRTLVHASANIIGSVSAAMSTNKYVLPTPIQRQPGEVYGYELSIRESVAGATHTVVGEPTWLHDDPDIFPRRISSRRDSGTSAPPSTIAHASTVYADKIPFIEAAISLEGAVSAPHADETKQWTTPGTLTYPIPSWCDEVDAVALGHGGDGYPGSSTLFVNGRGGENGNWDIETWVRDVDFTDGDVLTITIPTPGSGGNASISIPGHGVVGTPGVDGSGWGTPNEGQAAGTQTVNGHPYVGGVQQNTLGAAGSTPGGGGAGGGYGPQAGGPGAGASAWATFRRT